MRLTMDVRDCKKFTDGRRLFYIGQDPDCYKPADKNFIVLCQDLGRPETEAVYKGFGNQPGTVLSAYASTLLWYVHVHNLQEYKEENVCN
ncbi:MAG: hypothetical protein LKF34_03565 [Acidaminococcaceae bacterium]|jgi:hypothetical protein|nr:hypothetical protein [Acidaminococcaceae bacterium]